MRAYQYIIGLLFGLLIFTQPCPAPVLDSYQTFMGAGDPADARRVGNNAILVRGTGTRNFYYLEVDPATGKLPVDATFPAGINVTNFPATVSVDYGLPTVSTIRTAAMLGIGTTAVSNSNPVPMSDAGGSITVDGTVAVSNLPATADTDYGAAGASTIRTAAMLGVGAAAVSNANPVPMSDAGGTITVDGTVAVSNLPTTADTDYGAPGASTLRSAAMLGVGTAAVSNGNPVPISDAGGAITVDGTVAVSNLPATADTNFGTPGASTLRTAAMLGVGSTAVSTGNPVPTAAVGRTYVTSVRNDYSSTAVTTGAWVQLVASTSAPINALTLFDSCGQTLELGTGAAASETRALIIPPGGIDGQFLLNFSTGTRISVRAISGTCASGELNITAFG